MVTRNLVCIAALLSVLAIVGCSGRSSEQHLAAARQYLQDKNDKAAIIEIKNALQKNPDLAEARLMLATALMTAGNPAAAEVEFRKALAAKAPPARVVPELAHAMILLGQENKLVGEFGSTRFGEPLADATLQTALVAAYGALGRPEQAQAALDAALAADPGHAPARLIGARRKAATGDIDFARAEVDAVLARSPGDADALKLKGDLLLLEKRPEQAVAAYRSALQADPKYLPAHFAVLALLMQQGKADEAARQFALLEQIAPRSPQTRFYDAQLALLKGEGKRARERVVELVQQMPSNALVLQLAGAIELQAGTPAQAEIYLSRALQIAPQLPLARRLLIAAYLRTGQAAQALTALDAAAGKDGALDPTLYSLAGQVHLQNGDVRRAEAYFAKALELDPEDARKRTQLAVTHLAGGQTAAALDELQDIAAADTGITADLALISAHLRRREFDQALAAIDRFEKKQPDKPLAANLRGRVQLAKQDRSAARQSFERALTIDPNFFAAASSLAALDMAEKKPDEAKKRFETLLARNPKSVPALLALAQLVAASGGGKEEVAALLNRAVLASPGDPIPRLRLIDHHLRHQDVEPALAAAQAAAAAAPDDPQLQLALGRVQQFSGDLNQAIAAYGRAAKLNPLSPLPLIRLAEAQAANGDRNAAEHSLRKALEVKPDDADTQRALIQLAVGDKRFADALAMARKLQVAGPRAGLGHLFEGDIHAARADWPKAVAAYRSALQANPTASEVAVKLHSALAAEAARAGDAERFAADWIARHPKDVAFVAGLAAAATAGKQYPAAEKWYRMVLQLQPDAPIALNNLAWIGLQMGRGDALGYAERANELVPNQPQFMDTWAAVLSSKGEHGRAIELQTQALALRPADNSLRLNLARIYLAAGEKSKARAQLVAVMKSGAKGTLHEEAGALLRTL